MEKNSYIPSKFIHLDLKLIIWIHAHVYTKQTNSYKVRSKSIHL